MRLLRIVGIALVSIFLLLPHPALAQTESRVAITTVVGYDNMYFGDSWTPVRITISDSPIAMPATIEWVVTADAQPTITWRRAVDLTPGTPLVIDTALIMPSYARSIIARVRSSEGIIASTQIDAQVAAGQLTVIVADKTSLADAFTKTATKDGSTPVVRVVPASAIPRTVVALQGVNTLLIADVQTLDDAQLRAIRLWCELGGRLVVAGPATGILADIAPFFVDSSKPAITTLGSAEAPALPIGLSIPAVQPAADATQVHPGSSLLWQRAVGRGQFLQSALSLTDSDGWSGQYWYWQPILAPSDKAYTATITLPATNSMFDPFINSLTIAAVRAPAPWLLFLIAVGYILLIGPVTYQILKRKNMLDAAWLTIPVTALITALVVIGSVYLSRGTSPHAYALRIVQQSASGRDAYVSTTTGIYAPFRDTFIAKAGAVGSIQKLTFTQGSAPVIADSRANGELLLPADIGSMQFLTTSQVIPVPVSVGATLRRQPDLLHGTITVHGITLSDAYLQIGSFAQALGTITPDTAVAVSITQNSPSFPCDIPSPTNSMVSIQRVYEQLTGPCGATNLPLDGRVTLYGWTPISGALPDVSGLAYTDQRQLVVVTINVP